MSSAYIDRPISHIVPKKREYVSGTESRNAGINYGFNNFSLGYREVDGRTF
ncbi:hypothetical protein O6Y00_17585 [Sphingomonas faeni]